MVAQDKVDRERWKNVAELQTVWQVGFEFGALVRPKSAVEVWMIGDRGNQAPQPIRGIDALEVRASRPG